LKIHNFPDKDRRPFKVKCSLCFDGTFNPDKVSEITGLSPTVSWMKGDLKPVLTPQGKSGKHTFDFWEYSTNKERTANPEEVLDKLLEVIVPLKEPISLLLKEVTIKGAVVMMIDCIVDVDPGFHLSANILSKLAELNLELGFDIYSYSNE
jgi:hypothetical protein